MANEAEAFDPLEGQKPRTMVGKIVRNEIFDLVSKLCIPAILAVAGYAATTLTTLSTDITTLKIASALTAAQLNELEKTTDLFRDDIKTINGQLWAMHAQQIQDSK